MCKSNKETISSKRVNYEPSMLLLDLWKCFDSYVNAFCLEKVEFTKVCFALEPHNAKAQNYTFREYHIYKVIKKNGRSHSPTEGMTRYDRSRVNKIYAIRKLQIRV